MTHVSSMGLDLPRHIRACTGTGAWSEIVDPYAAHTAVSPAVEMYSAITSRFAGVDTTVRASALHRSARPQTLRQKSPPSDLTRERGPPVQRRVRGIGASRRASLSSRPGDTANHGALLPPSPAARWRLWPRSVPRPGLPETSYIHHRGNPAGRVSEVSVKLRQPAWTEEGAILILEP